MTPFYRQNLIDALHDVLICLDDAIPSRHFGHRDKYLLRCSFKAVKLVVANLEAKEARAVFKHQYYQGKRIEQ